MRLEPQPGLPTPGNPGIFWLGQAGFWIETGQHRLLIDPYLSDSLARKYAGKTNDHRRMMPPPLAVTDMPRPDLVLITHAHTDHMDPDTLRPLAQRFPDLPFLIPESRRTLAQERIGGPLIGITADQTLTPLPDLAITAFPAAHEQREQDAQGCDLYLGYGLQTPRLRLYHSGDSIPYHGLAERLAAFAPQIALMPVNGRDATRLAAGIPGNFTLEEAIALAADIPYLIAHHFGMFAFNTIDPEQIDRRARTRPGLMRPKAGEQFRIV